MRKRNIPIQTLSLQGLKTITADYGPKSMSLFVTGDDKNNLVLWKS